MNEADAEMVIDNWLEEKWDIFEESIGNADFAMAKAIADKVQSKGFDTEAFKMLMELDAEKAKHQPKEDYSATKLDL